MFDDEERPDSRRSAQRRPLMFGRFTAGTLCAALSSAAIAGCGGGGSSADSGTKSTKAATGAPATTTKNLSMAIGAEPGNLDPLLKSDGPRDSFAYSVYEGMTARANDKVIPALATKWESKGKSWIFHLRPNVKFQDGTPFTSADVVASWNRILSPKSELLGNFVDKKTKVSAVGPMAVKVTRPVADPTIPVRASLVFIAPKKDAALGNDALSTKMVGTGPYRFVQWNRGNEIKLKAFSGYWGKKPQIPTVDVHFDPEAAVRVAAMKTNEIQMALNMSPDLARGGDFGVKAGPASEVLIVRLNSQHGPFKDPRVRAAANLSVDRKVLIDKIYGGYAKPAQAQEITNSVFGFDPAQKDYPFALDRAKALLKQAGAEGTTVVLSGTRGHWANDAEVAQAVAGMLTKAGFKVKLKIPVFSQWVKEIFIAETNDAAAPDMSIYNHSNQLFDASLTFGQNLTCDGTSSTTCIKSVDADVAKAATSTDQAEREKLYSDAWATLKAQNAFVAIANVYHVSFLAKDINWNPPADGFVRIQDLTFSS